MDLEDIQPNDHCFHLYLLKLYVGFDWLLYLLIQEQYRGNGMKEWIARVAERYFRRDFVNYGFQHFEITKRNL